MFENASVPTLSRKKICEALWQLWEVKKAENPMKTDFWMLCFPTNSEPVLIASMHELMTGSSMRVLNNYALFPNEFRASVNCIDAWAYDWVPHARPQHSRIIRQQGDESVMILTEIIGSPIIRPFQVTEGIMPSVYKGRVSFKMTTCLLGLISRITHCDVCQYFNNFIIRVLMTCCIFRSNTKNSVKKQVY